jgi:addiction module HigA family antidote
MREKKRMPAHPGGILKRLYLDALSISNSQLAETLGVSRKTISKIVNGRGAITPDMALRLSRAFNTTPDLWLDLQKNCDLWQATHRSTDWQKVKMIHAGDLQAPEVSG